MQDKAEVKKRVFIFFKGIEVFARKERESKTHHSMHARHSLHDRLLLLNIAHSKS